MDWSVYDDYHCMDDNAVSPSSSTYSMIGCNQSVSGHLTCGETKYFLFHLADDDNVVITNCDTHFDSTMHIYSMLTHHDMTKLLTVNQCDGDFCPYPPYCIDPMHVDTETP